jgi:tRNA(Ile)-lysidine synthetase-like protein
LPVNLGAKAGRAEFRGARFSWRFSSRKLPGWVKGDAAREMFDADRVGSEITLRHWRRGDRFQPIGMKHAVKLQDFFINEKVPRARRHELIVAQTAAGEVFWVEDQRISERFKVTEQTIRRLQWRWQRL